MRPGRLLPLLLGLAACAGAPPAASRTGADGRPARVRLAVRGRAQRHSLSCESRSAADLLGYHGIHAGEDAILAALPRSDNPHEGFVGDVDDPGGGLPPAGYGVYAEPVAAVLSARGLPAAVVSGRRLDWLRGELAAGRPVIVWATAALDVPGPQWRTDRAGRRYRVVQGEHTFLAVGYEPGRVLLLDPATGKEKRVFASRFDASWATLGRMAVAADPRAGR